MAVFVGGAASRGDSVNYVECIQSGGTQRIDAGVSYNANNEYVIETECKATSEGAAYSGWNAGGAFGYSYGKWATGSGTSQMSCTEFTNIKLTIQAGSSSNTVMELEQNGSTETLTRTHGSIASYATLTYPIFVCTNNSGGYHSYTKIAIKHLSIKVNGTLIRDYWPCYDPDGVACLYDKVNKEYVYNAGTGEFTAGGSGGEEDSKTITFTIADVAYQADTGMTWAQWVASSYNTAGYVNQSWGIVNAANTATVKPVGGSSDVSPTDTIVSGGIYYHNPL